MVNRHPAARSEDISIYCEREAAKIKKRSRAAGNEGAVRSRFIVQVGEPKQISTNPGAGGASSLRGKAGLRAEYAAGNSRGAVCLGPSC